MAIFGEPQRKISDIMEGRETPIGALGKKPFLHVLVIKILFAVVGVVIASLALWVVLAAYGVVPSPDFPAVDARDWQAVFLTNNQVYFGHLKNYNKEYTFLSNVFYLRVAEPLQQGSPPTTQPGINLVKLGGELHGPEDAMYLPKDKILFWENLRSDSQVVQAITNFLATQ